MKFCLKKKVLFYVSCIGIVLINISCGVFKDTPKEISKKFEETTLSPIIYTENYEGREVRFLVSKKIDNTLPTIIFIHGAPGSLGNYFSYLKDTVSEKQKHVLRLVFKDVAYRQFISSQKSEPQI